MIFSTVYDYFISSDFHHFKNVNVNIVDDEDLSKVLDKGKKVKLIWKIVSNKLGRHGKMFSCNLDMYHQPLNTEKQTKPVSCC